MSNSRPELEASEWLSRIDAGGASPQTSAALAAWRAADPRNEVAYLRLKAGWNRLDRLQSLRPAEGIDANLLSPPELAEKVRSFKPHLLLAAMLAAAVCTVGLIYAFVRTPTYSTAVGGFERVQLADGSIVELNTNTRIRSQFDDAHRTVELLKGEAHFTVTRDPVRPFVVVAGQSAVRAVGTAFNVRRYASGDIHVIVTDGRVSVGTPVSVAAADPVRSDAATSMVSTGQAASMSRGRLQVRNVPRTEADRELAWQSGMLLFEDTRLSEVVEEFNRYNRTQLVVDDAALGSLKIGGYFKATGMEAFLNVLQRDFSIHADAAHDRIVLRSEPPAR